MIYRRFALIGFLVLVVQTLPMYLAGGGPQQSAASESEGRSRAANNRQFLGLYQVIGKADCGSDVNVVLQLQLFNRGSNDLQIEYAALATPHHVQGNWKRVAGSRVDAHGSQTITEEFTVPRREYERWQKTSPPKLVLDTRTSWGERHIETVLLDNRGKQEGN
jgi:hypothetical protein